VKHNAFPEGVTRESLLDWYRRLRSRSKSLFAIASEDAWYDRPIPLRNPLVFYEGHIPAFTVNTLVKLAHGKPGVDAELETLFARGIDPEDVSAVRDPASSWPSRERVAEFVAACDALIEDTLLSAPLSDDAVPALRDGEAVFTILEHEGMHQETLSYLMHALPYEKKNGGGFPRERRVRIAGPSEPVQIPPGRATLGLPRGASYGWDNEFPSFSVDVGAFTIDPFKVTNGDYLEFMEATGAKAPHFWLRGESGWYLRGMFEPLALDLDAPVYATHDEAQAFARWKGGRLPTEAEFHRAAYGTPEGIERAQPWGDALPDARHGNFDFASFDPQPVGAYPEGASAWGIHDLVGNGWEWTSSFFRGFEGFEPMPSYQQYSIDFFDDAHYVIKGASPVTPREMIRRSFRNWFRPNYPYVFATFRVVRDSGAVRS
jgi:iron(II)-dependent oxidoreductase